MSNHVFRENFLKNQHQVNGGVILISSGIGQRLISGFCFVMTVVLVLLLIIGSYTKKTQLEGVVMPTTGLIYVKSSTSGVIDELYVEDGQKINKSKSLFRVINESYDETGESFNRRLAFSLEQQITSIKSQLEYEKLMGESRIAELQSKVERVKLEIETAKQSLVLAKERTLIKQGLQDSYKKLVKNNFVSDLVYKDYRSSLISLKSDEENKKMLLHQLEREKSSSSYQINNIKLQVEMRAMELERQLNSLSKDIIEIKSSTEKVIHSPVSGEVSSLRVENGQSVNQGEVILNIIPEDSDLQIELYAPSRSIGFIEPGQKVGLRFDAYPHEKFGIQEGTVVRISESNLTPTELKVLAQSLNNEKDTLYKILVSIEKRTISVYGNEEPLKVGMRVKANVNLETRKLYEWLLGPISRIQGFN